MSHTFGRVVVGVDGSLGSLQALRFAVGHARAFGAILVPVLAWTPPGGELSNHRYPVASLTIEWQRDAGRRLRTAFDEGLGGWPGGLDVSALVLRGPAGRLLVAVADRQDDLLVVGTGRRGAFRQAVRGSVSQYCVAHAQCPVIAVPPGPLAEQFGSARAGLRLHREPWDDASALDLLAGGSESDGTGRRKSHK
jgi:nucleotide-binding universal stress UspA family protein